MISVAFLVAAQTVGGRPLIGYQNRIFAIQEGSSRVEVPLRETRAAPEDKLVIREGDRWVVWDARGLTIRIGRQSRTTQLEPIATSPRALSEEGIREAQAAIRAGTRQAGASTLAGYERVGTALYLLVRWHDDRRAPWLEALVRVDMTADAPAWEFVGRFDGFSQATGEVDDRLFAHGDALVVPTLREDGWGFARYSLGDGSFDFMWAGEPGPITIRPLPERGVALFTQRTPYRTVVAGVADLRTAETRPVAEHRGDLGFVGDTGRVVRLARQGFAALRNVDNGLEIRIPADAAVRWTTSGVLMWTPRESPNRAVLYNPGNWRVRAEWPAPPPSAGNQTGRAPRGSTPPGGRGGQSR